MTVPILRVEERMSLTQNWMCTLMVAAAVGCAVAGIEAQQAAAPAAAPVPTESNVVYGMHGGLALLLDVYRPPQPNGHGVLVLQGSGFHSPSMYGAPAMKNTPNARNTAARLAAAGYTVFAVNHRTAPVFRHPAAFEDVQRAVRFVRSRAAEYGMATGRLGVIGWSSGATLAALLGAVGGAGDARGVDPVDRLSASVWAVVGVATPTDLSAPITEPLAAVLLTSYFGTPIFPGPQHDPKTRQLLMSASPLHRVGKGSAAMLLIHGDADTLVPISQAEAMVRALTSVGVPARLLRVPGGTHDQVAPPGAPEHEAEMVAWLDQHLRTR